MLSFLAHIRKKRYTGLSRTTKWRKRKAAAGYESHDDTFDRLGSVHQHAQLAEYADSQPLEDHGDGHNKSQISQSAQEDGHRTPDSMSNTAGREIELDFQCEVVIVQ